MKSVNILRNNAGELSASFKLRKLFVGSIGTRPGVKHFISEKIVKPVWMFFKICAADNSLRRQVTVLFAVQSVSAAKIGDAALR